jgi:pantothenate kinase
MPRAGFKQATPATKRPQTLDRAAIGIGGTSSAIRNFLVNANVFSLTKQEHSKCDTMPMDLFHHEIV